MTKRKHVSIQYEGTKDTVIREFWDGSKLPIDGSIKTKLSLARWFDRKSFVEVIRLNVSYVPCEILGELEEEFTLYGDYYDAFDLLRDMAMDDFEANLYNNAIVYYNGLYHLITFDFLEKLNNLK